MSGEVAKRRQALQGVRVGRIRDNSDKIVTSRNIVLQSLDQATAPFEVEVASASNQKLTNRRSQMLRKLNANSGRSVEMFIVLDGEGEVSGPTERITSCMRLEIYGLDSVSWPNVFRHDQSCAN